MNSILTGTMSIHYDTLQADYEQYTDRHKVYTLTRYRLTMNNILTGTKSAHYEQDDDRHNIFTL